jgi:hypothetical protein
VGLIEQLQLHELHWDAGYPGKLLHLNQALLGGYLAAVFDGRVLLCSLQQFNPFQLRTNVLPILFHHFVHRYSDHKNKQVVNSIY